MIQLIAYNQSSDSPTYLDIDEDEDISLNFAVSEVKDFSTRKSSRSDSFSLPFTDTNNQFFNHLYNVNLATGNFDIYQRTNCEIRVDSLPQIKGYLYVNSINLTTERYEVTIIGEVGNLKDELGEKKLSDLDNDWMATFTHELTKDNIVNSWDFNITYTDTPQDQSGIVYPFINYGIDNRVWTLGGANDIKSSSTPIQPYEFKPAFRVKTLFERILAEAGYSYDSNFLDNDDFEFDKIYMNLASEFDLVKYRVTPQGFKATMTADQKIATNSSTTIEYDNDSAPDGYDLNSQYNTTTYQFTTSVEGTYRFINYILVEFTRNDATSEFSTIFYFDYIVNGTSIGNSANYSIGASSDGETVQVLYKVPSNVNMNSGDTYNMNIVVIDPTSPNTFFVRTTGSFFQLIAQPNQPNGENIHLVDNLPNIRQTDFIKAIFEHFNMFVEPKQDNPTELLIEPYPDYMDRGTTVDWTDKLDLNKEVQIIPTTDFRNKVLKWRWQEGKNYNAKYAQDVREKNYGEYIREDESDLTEGEFQNYTVFAEPTNRLINISGTTEVWELCVMDLSSRDQNGTVVPSKDKPRIFYFKKKELESGKNYYLWDEATATADQVNAYGYAGHYSDVPASTGMYDLNWSVQSPIYNYGVWVNTPTNLNPFIQYWNSYYNELYSQEARLLKGKFYLTPIDIHNLRFNNKVFVKDCFYRINKISNYKPNSQEPCDVELIKLFDAKVGLGNDCDLVVSAFLESGLVKFQDGNGDNATATKDCCEGYGYTWYAGDTGGCYWKRLIGDNGDPFEPTPNDGNPEEE